jgi:hypothetical protein
MFDPRLSFAQRFTMLNCKLQPPTNYLTFVDLQTGSTILAMAPGSYMEDAFICHQQLARQQLLYLTPGRFVRFRLWFARTFLGIVQLGIPGK